MRSTPNCTLFITFVLMLFCYTARAKAPPLKVSYEIKAKQQWNKDYETEKPDEGKEHLVLRSDETIDILLSFADEKLLAELDKQGLEKTLAQLLNAKNKIQELVSDDPVVFKNTKLENIDNGKKISLEADFTFGKKKYHTQEHYFLFEKKVLHTVLRWNEESSKEQLELAKNDFKAISVKMK